MIPVKGFHSEKKHSEAINDIDINELNKPEDVLHFPHLSKQDCSDMQSILNEFTDVLTTKLGSCDLMEYEIDLKDPTPVRLKPYPLSPPHNKKMREIIQKLLDNDVIEASTSKYSSPAFLVPKGNNDFRLVVNYKSLNKNIQTFMGPLPDVHSAFHYLQGASVYTIMDLNQAYFQLKLNDKSKPLTAFATPFNLYQFKRVPMGLSVGASILNSLMDHLLHDIKYQFVFNFADDIIIYSENMEQHKQHLREVLNRLRKANLTVNPEKVQFAVEEISFLGHRVRKNNIMIDPDRTKALRDYPVPRNSKDVSRFLGMVNFLNKFIPDWAELSLPLNELRKKSVKFKWTDVHQRNFELLKERISNPPVLKMADFDREFILQTDGSSVGISSCLMQELDGVRFPIAYYSRKLTDQERKYSIYEIECLSVVAAMDKFRSYLEVKPFKLEVDNLALTWILSHHRKLGRIERWIAKIQSLQFTVTHIKGSQNYIADALSRMFETPEEGVKDQRGDGKSGNETEDALIHERINALLTDFPLAFTGIKEHQDNDEDIQEIKARLRRGDRMKADYVITKDVLLLKEKKNKKTRVVLPKHLIPMVFKFYHESPVGGHLGCFRTLNKIRQTFIWKGMRKQVFELVKMCTTCMESKPANKIYGGEYVSDHSYRCMDKLYIDYVGPLPRTAGGNTAIFIAVDDFSKFTWFFPVRDITSANAIRSLEETVFKNFSPARVIVSDNAKQFKSKDFKNMCFSYGIKHITTSVYYPKGNLSERHIRDLKAALVSYHSDAHNTWDQNLKYLQLALNTAVSRTTMSSPFDLLFNFTANLPLINQWDLKELIPEVAQRGNIKELYNTAIKHIKKVIQQNRNSKEIRGVWHPFKVGSLVFVKTHPQSKKIDKVTQKLAKKFEGPYRVKRFLTPVTVEIAQDNCPDVVKRSHISFLKLSEYAS